MTTYRVIDGELAPLNALNRRYQRRHPGHADPVRKCPLCLHPLAGYVTLTATVKPTTTKR